MRKINALTLPYEAIRLCFIAFLLVITSCKKDITDVGKLSKTDLETLKDWQSKNFDQNSILFSGMVPNWNNVYVNQLKDKTVYEVELTPTDNAFMTNGFLRKGDKNDYRSKSRFKLLILKDAKTEKITDGYYMSSISNEPVHYTQTDQFTGYIYFYNTKGNFINGWSFDAGKAVQGIRSGTYAGYKETMNSGLTEKINMSNFGNGKIQVEAPGNTCYTMSFPVYATSCISVEDSPPICSIYIKGYVYGQFCPGVQISPDGSGGVVPDPNTPIGQPPVVPTTPTVPGGDPNDITNNVKDPCLKLMVQLAIDRGINFSAEETLKSIFGENSNINLFFGEKNYANSGTDGGTLINRVLKNANGTIARLDITISLNTPILQNASQEYITATILHEALHAYFDFKNGQSDETGQHVTMSSQPYITQFSAKMQQIYPNMSNEDALALAWGGLEGTPAYDDLRAAQPYNVGQMFLANGQYKDGEKGTQCPIK